MPKAVRIVLRMRFVGIGISTIICHFVRVEDTEEYHVFATGAVGFGSMSCVM